MARSRGMQALRTRATYGSGSGRQQELRTIPLWDLEVAAAGRIDEATDTDAAFADNHAAGRG
jgi:hypothetical protein